MDQRTDLEELEHDLWDALDRVAEHHPEDAKLLAWACGTVNWKPKEQKYATHN